MKEIKCPHCGKVFTVDESEYAAILGQVRNAEFNNEVEARLHTLQQQQQAQHEAEVLKKQQDYMAFIRKKDNELSELRSQVAMLQQRETTIRQEEQLRFSSQMAEKDSIIQQLKSDIALSKQDVNVARLEEQNRSQAASTSYSSLQRLIKTGFVIRTSHFEIEDPFFHRWILQNIL